MMMLSSVEPSVVIVSGDDDDDEVGEDEEDIVATTERRLSTDTTSLTADSILGSDHPIPIDDDNDEGDDDGTDGEAVSSVIQSLQSSNDDDDDDDILASISGCGSDSSSGDEPIFNDDNDNIDDLYEHKYYTRGEEDDGRSNTSYYSNDDQDDDHDEDHDEEEEASLYDDDDDLSLGFPPGYVLTLDDLDTLHYDSKVSLYQDSNTTNTGKKKSTNNNVNPAIVPSFFYCPLTRSIMRDPVITPDGYTYERRAILRFLCLGLGLDPMSNNPLQHVDLVEDRLVRQAIDKARKEAWIRYVVELPNIDDENDNNNVNDNNVRSDDKVDNDDVMNDTYHDDKEDELNDSKIDRIISVVNTSDIKRRERDDDDDDDDADKNDDDEEEEDPLLIVKKKTKSHRHHRHHRHHQHEDADENTVSTPTLSNNGSLMSQSQLSHHGWSVPLGVHRITCMSPGLLVTADVHRRSNIVQRKIIHNSLAKDDDDKEGMVGSYRKIKQKTKKKKKGGGTKIVTGVKTRDLLLPSGAYVEILETRVHGGRVRGRIVWEEEVITEYDHDVILHLEEVEVRERAMTRPKQQQHHNANDSPSKKRLGRKATVGAAVRKASAAANKTLFRRKSISGMGGTAGLFASDLFGATIMSGGGGGAVAGENESIGEQKKREEDEEDLVDTSPSPLTTIKYSGWISLQWTGSEDNKEYDVIERRRRTTSTFGESSPETELSSVAADEDEGPWSQPLPLGVYRIGVSGDDVGDVVTIDDDHRDAGHLPLHDAPDDESNAIDYLVPGQCIEIVETQVLVMKKKKKKRKSTKDGRIYTKYSSVDAVGEQVVRARCMVPVVIKAQRKFRNGWITLFGREGTTKDVDSIAAFPMPLGAYVFKADDPLLLGDNKVKFPIGSIVEVVTTRIEFEDKEREGMQHSAAVRGLVASGGYVTLYAISIGASGTSLRLSGFARSKIYAASVPLGTYRITHPTNLSNDDAVTQLEKNERVQIVETRVEDGCIRGRVGEVFSARRSCHINSKVTQKTIGWISLFEPPSLRWAEHICEEKEVP